MKPNTQLQLKIVQLPGGQKGVLMLLAKRDGTVLHAGVMSLAHKPLSGSAINGTN